MSRDISPTAALTRRGWGVLIAIAAAALILRLGYGLSQNHNIPYLPGGNDPGWYLITGYQLMTGQTRDDVPMGISTLAPAPLYLIFVGIPQAFLPLETSVIVIRILQAVMSAAMCLFAYRLGLRLTDSSRVGLTAAALVAFSPAFIIESAQVTTETLYMFLLAGAMSLIIEYIARAGVGWRWLIASAALFGLATLTRAVLLAYPFALAVLLVILYRKAGIKRGAVFFAVFAAVVLTWTVYNLARWNRFVIAGDGLFSFIYIGASGWDDPYVFDQRLMESLGREDELPTGDPEDEDFMLHQEDYAQAAALSITADPVGWVQRRVSELAGAYLMPHATTAFSGESLRDLAVTWLQEDRSLEGLMRLTQGDYFWQKLSLYVFHYGVILLGVIGIIKTRRNWRISLPMLGFLAYVTLVHLVLYALPRYLFPAMIFWIVYAASAFAPIQNDERADHERAQ